MTTMGRLSLGAMVIALAVLLGGAGGAAAGPLDAPGYAKAFACSACHGFGGASRSDTIPVLAGMPAWYLKKAIEDYAAGKRPAAEMEPYAKMVKELGVDDVAGYFAAQKKAATPLTPDAAGVARGRAAAAPCVACHGPAGKGDPAKGVPDLTGQPAGYLLNQMLLFKADRRSPGDATLRDLKAAIRPIPEATLADLAAYYSSLK
jgi:cytochrome c553